MKKEFIKPITTVYNIQLVRMVALSVEDGDENNPLNEDDFGEGGNYEIDARNSNGGNIWDNIW